MLRGPFLDRIGLSRRWLMSTHAIERRAGMPARIPSTARRHVEWLAAGLVLGFAVPFVFADLLALPRDLYYGIYIAFVATFFAAWAKLSGQDLVEMVRRRRATTIALGFLFGGLVALLVLKAADATVRPGGLRLAAAVVWRGVLYGAADGLLLSAFPILAVFAAFSGTRLRERLSGKLAIGASALVASLGMTAAYHAGYSDFRSGKIGQPLRGDALWSAPTLLTLNPIGAPVAHASMHVTAVLHSYDTDLFLPPHR
jgi:hypothetical protein